MATHPIPPRPATAPFVGRERELATLRDTLAATLAGRGSLVLIGGAAGIGKTALAEALLAEAEERGALALVGRCYDLGETPPYGPWRELLGGAPRGEGLPSLPAAVLPAEQESEALASQEAILRRILAYLAAITAGRPAVMLLEDVHWADAASLDLLRFLGRSIAGSPVLLLATYRADELAPDHPLAALLPALVRESRIARLDLRPLDDAAIGALVAARYALGGADRTRLTRYLARRTEGNALFLEELLRTLEATGALRREGERWALDDLTGVPVPTLLRQVIAARLARLSDEDRRFLAVAAVLGQEPPFDLWTTVGAAEEGALLATAERAVAARVLEVTEAGVRFAHALIREALYDGVLAPRRRAWHRRAGEALLATAHPDPDMVAHHLRQADDPRATEWLVAAGERAQRAYAWVTAAERFEAALALLERQAADPPRRIVLLITLAQMRRYADTRQGVALMEEAVRLADATGDAAQAASARFEAGHLRCIAGAASAGLAAMAAALPALEALAPAERARLPALRILGVSTDAHYHRGVLVHWSAETGRYAVAWDLAAPFRAPVSGSAGRGLTGLAYVHMALGRPDEARRTLAASRALFRASGQLTQVAGSFQHELEDIALAYEADRVAGRRRLAAEAVAAMAQASGIVADISPRFVTLELLALEGGWAEARALATVGRASTYVGFRQRAANVFARLARLQGDHDLAWAAVREVLAAGPTTEPDATYFSCGLVLLRVAAALALDGDDLAGARSWLEAHDRWLAWSGTVRGRADGALGWAGYHRAAGNHALAHGHAAQALTHATAPRQPLALLAAHRALGELETAAGRHADADTHLATALALADACAAPYERALCLLALAELGTAGGRAGEAGARLVEARAILAPLGARPALARALAGARPPRRAVAARGRGAAAPRGWAGQPRDCADAVPQPAHGAAPRRECVPEDRRAQPRRGHRLRPPPPVGLSAPPPATYLALPDRPAAQRDCISRLHTQADSAGCPAALC